MKNKLKLFWKKSVGAFSRKTKESAIPIFYQDDADHSMWKKILVCGEGGAMLFGVNAFSYPWENTGEKETLPDPVYHEPKTLNVYTITVDGKEHTFAAGEISYGVYMFYY